MLKDSKGDSSSGFARSSNLDANPLNLHLIYELMVKKLREIQVGEDFDSELHRIKTASHGELTDAQYFHELIMIAFESALGGEVIKKHKAELSEAFSNYDFSAVAKEDFATLLAKSPIKNRKKVRGSLKNAQEFTILVAKYGSFENYLRSFGDVEHNTESFLRMQRDMRGRFNYVGPTNFRAFMKYIGFDSLKDDRHVRQIMSRLGLISSATCPQEEVISAAIQISKATGEKLSVIDQVFYTFGSSDSGRVKEAICGDKPVCKKCYLPEHCAYFKSRSQTAIV